MYIYILLLFLFFTSLFVCVCLYIFSCVEVCARIWVITIPWKFSRSGSLVWSYPIHDFELNVQDLLNVCVWINILFGRSTQKQGEVGPRGVNFFTKKLYHIYLEDKVKMIFLNFQFNQLTKPDGNKKNIEKNSCMIHILLTSGSFFTIKILYKLLFTTKRYSQSTLSSKRRWPDIQVKDKLVGKNMVVDWSLFGLWPRLLRYRATVILQIALVYFSFYVKEQFCW